MKDFSMSVNWNKVRQPFQQVWNWLTSMRTALILLFILAFAAVPGALLPQRSLNKDKVDQYSRQRQDRRDHG